jgi:PST family polysaccharide transporter
MTSKETQEYTKNSIRGIAALAGRTLFSQIVAVAATFGLTVFLTPAEYGVFFAVSALIHFLVYFSDIGLAAALVQKEDVTEREISTTFVIQQILVVILTLVSLLFTSKIAQFYNLGEAGRHLIMALIISFFLSSLKTIPTILLERNLQFHKLVIPQILEKIVFYGVAVYFAWQGLGITAFTYAVLLRGLVGVVSIYIIKPYFPKLGVQRSVARKLISTGAFFQANSILALLKDDLMVLFLGKILPLTQVGYIGWGQKWAFFPLKFILNNVNKVAFPAYSRVQHTKDLLRKALEKTLYWMSVLIFPMMVGMILSVPLFIDFYPQYSKWQPAVVVLIFYCLNGVFGSLSNVFTNMLNATGRIKTTLRIMVGMTVLNWVLTLSGIELFGYQGVAIASWLVAAFGMIAAFYVRKYIKYRFWRHVKPAAVSTVVMSLVFFASQLIYINNLITLLIAIFISGGAYLLSLVFFFKELFFEELDFVLKQWK